MMPVGPRRDVARPRSAAAWYVGAEPTTGTGRLCGTPVRNAPSVTRTRRRSPGRVDHGGKVRQRMFGSTAVKKTTSRLPLAASVNRRSASRSPG